MHNQTVKFAMENDATQISEVSKYQLISQLTFDKFQLQCYSKNNVRYDSHWFPRSNANVCTTDQQHRLSSTILSAATGPLPAS